MTVGVMGHPILTGVFNGRPLLLQIPGLFLAHDYCGNVDMVNGGPATAALSVTRASSGTYKNLDGSISSFSSNAARIGNRGLLIEESRTNSKEYSQDFTNATHVKINTTASADTAAAPDSTVTADSILETATTASHYVTISNPVDITGGQSNTVSIFVKANGRRYVTMSIDAALNSSAASQIVGFDLQSGVVTTTSGSGFTYAIESYIDGWWRISITFTAVASPVSGNCILGTRNTSGAGLESYLGDITKGLYVWGAQVEVGAFPTSYIPTVASDVTRAADTIVTSSFSWFNATEGTFYARGSTEAPITGGQNNGLFGADDGTVNERMQVRKSSTGTTWLVADGGAVQASSGVSGIPNPSAVRLAGAYAVNDFRLAANGTLATPDTSGTLPTVTTGRIGFAQGVNYLNGYLKEAAYFNRALADAELQAITAETP